MDDDRFDDLARRIASGSRRQLLRGLLAGLGATFGIQDARAKKERGSEQVTQPDPAQATEQDALAEQNTGDLDSPDTAQPPPDQQQVNHHQSKDKQHDHPRGKRPETSDAQDTPDIQQDKPKDNQQQSHQRDPGNRKDKQQASGGGDQTNDGANDVGGNEQEAGGEDQSGDQQSIDKKMARAAVSSRSPLRASADQAAKIERPGA